MMVFMSLVLVLIGQFCRDVIDHQNVKVVVISQLLLLLFFIHLLFVCRSSLRSCMSRLYGTGTVAVDISSEVLVLSLCTSFLMSVVVGSLCCE